MTPMAYNLNHESTQATDQGTVAQLSSSLKGKVPKRWVPETHSQNSVPVRGVAEPREEQKYDPKSRSKNSSPKTKKKRFGKYSARNKNALVGASVQEMESQTQALRDVIHDLKIEEKETPVSTCPKATCETKYDVSLKSDSPKPCNNLPPNEYGYQPEEPKTADVLHLGGNKPKSEMLITSVHNYPLDSMLKVVSTLCGVVHIGLTYRSLRRGSVSKLPALANFGFSAALVGSVWYYGKTQKKIIYNEPVAPLGMPFVREILNTTHRFVLNLDCGFSTLGKVALDNAEDVRLPQQRGATKVEEPCFLRLVQIRHLLSTEYCLVNGDLLDELVVLNYNKDEENTDVAINARVRNAAQYNVSASIQSIVSAPTAKLAKMIWRAQQDFQLRPLDLREYVALGFAMAHVLMIFVSSNYLQSILQQGLQAIMQLNVEEKLRDLWGRTSKVLLRQ